MFRRRRPIYYPRSLVSLIHKHVNANTNQQVLTYQVDKYNNCFTLSGDRVCLWEQCFEKYPNQSTLVEHIERAHVNTYKGKIHYDFLEIHRNQQYRSDMCYLMLESAVGYRIEPYDVLNSYDLNEKAPFD